MRSGDPGADRGSAPDPDVVLRSTDLRKSYGEVEVVGGLNLSVRRGEFVSLVGPSGCGKTTLLMALSGLLRADSGRVEFEGTEIRDVPARLTVVFQDYSRALFPWKTNLDNVLLGMRRLSGRSDRDKAERSRELLSAVGLKGFEAHYPWQLSGGMQQRVAIARGLATESALMLLDEPLAAVDAQTRADMQDLLLDLAEKYRQTCLLVTHDVEEAVYMATRVVVLAPRPTRVDMDLSIDLPRQRDQITTRENPVFLHARHEILSRIKAMRRQATRGEA